MSLHYTFFLYCTRQFSLTVPTKDLFWIPWESRGPCLHHSIIYYYSTTVLYCWAFCNFACTQPTQLKLIILILYNYKVRPVFFFFYKSSMDGILRSRKDSLNQVYILTHSVALERNFLIPIRRRSKKIFAHLSHTDSFDLPSFLPKRNFEFSSHFIITVLFCTYGFELGSHMIQVRTWLMSVTKYIDGMENLLRLRIELYFVWLCVDYT